MITTNLNNISIFIFIIFIIICLSVFYFTYKDYKKLKNKYKLFQISTLLLSFIILSFGIFWFKTEKDVNTNSLWTNIVFVLDVSKSMKALDFSQNNTLYSRLQASKNFISNFISKYIWNKYALVVFAWDSMRVLPFTDDANLFLTILSWVDENNVTKQWTDIEDAINNWLKNFTDDNKDGVLVLISDWDDWNTIDLSKIQNKNLWKNIKLLVIWVWSTKWSYIPEWQDVFGQITYKTYNWTNVVTKLDEKNLKEIASKYNWTYYSLKDLSNINVLSDLLNWISKKQILTKTENSFDLTRNIVILSFIFFVIYLILLLKYDKNK